MPIVGPDPTLVKLTVEERVRVMARAANDRYKCTVTINQSNRSPEQAQQFHVCHMFLHNMFKKLRPKHIAKDGRTIDWDHLSKPEIAWALITNRGQFLRTKSGDPAALDAGGTAWAAGKEPDKKASVKAMAAFLTSHHVRSMAAPGQNGCGEPCGCGGMASKHITGKACDVSGMPELFAVLKKDYKGSGDPLDEFLKEFGLYRPMAHLEGKKREEWHVEALPETKTPKPKKHAATLDGAAHPLAVHGGQAGMAKPGAAAMPAH
jgi:hypothetical protein